MRSPWPICFKKDLFGLLMNQGQDPQNEFTFTYALQKDLFGWLMNQNQDPQKGKTNLLLLLLQETAVLSWGWMFFFFWYLPWAEFVLNLFLIQEVCRPVTWLKMISFSIILQRLNVIFYGNLLKGIFKEHRSKTFWYLPFELPNKSKRKQ